MKKFLCLILVVCLSLSLSACGDKKVDENSFESMQEYANDVKSQKEQRAQKEQKQYDSNKKSISEALSVPECTLKLKEYAVIDSTLYEGKKNIAITFDYTNNEEANRSFGAVVSPAAAESHLTLYQDGIELRTELIQMRKNDLSAIKQGTTIETIYGFTLENEISDVEVELMNYSGEKSTCIIKLN